MMLIWELKFDDVRFLAIVASQLGRVYSGSETANVHITVYSQLQNSNTGLYVA